MIALKDLSTEQMLALSGAWLDPTRARPLLEAHPRAAAVLDELGEAHSALLAASPGAGGPAPDAELAALLRKEQELDRRHDARGQGVIAVLTGLSMLSDDPARSAGWLALRDLLAPEGLGFATMAPLDEAKNTARARARLAARPALAEQLERAALPGGGTLGEAVRAWLEAGDQLGQLEARRAELLRRVEGARHPSGAGQLAARAGWGRAVQALEGALALRPELLTVPLVNAVLRPLRAALAPPASDDDDTVGDGSVLASPLPPRAKRR